MIEPNSENLGVQQRREFLRRCAWLAGVGLAGAFGSEAPLQAEAKIKSVHSSHLVRFGRTHLYVSRLCQGTAFRKVTRDANDPEAQRILHHAIDIGVNFFDSSEAYGWGGAETALGKAIAGRRDKLVICTKAANTLFETGGQGKKIRFTKEMLFGKAEGSLKRLGTDYLDLYLLHGPDEATPMEEIADSMDALVRSGKIRYWGVSNHKSEDVAKLVDLGKRKGKSPIAGLEDYYNIIAADSRDFMVREMFPLIRKGKLGLMAFSPLGEGRLAPGRELEKGSPLEEVVNALDRVAKDLAVSRPQVCVAWVLTRPEVTSVLAGAERPEHVEENLKGTQLVLPAGAVKMLDAASDAYTLKVKDKKRTP